MRELNLITLIGILKTGKPLKITSEASIPTAEGRQKNIMPSIPATSGQDLKRILLRNIEHIQKLNDNIKKLNQVNTAINEYCLREFTPTKIAEFLSRVDNPNEEIRAALKKVLDGNKEFYEFIVKKYLKDDKIHIPDSSTPHTILSAFVSQQKDEKSERSKLKSEGKEPPSPPPSSTRPG